MAWSQWHGRCSVGGRTMLSIWMQTIGSHPLVIHARCLMRMRMTAQDGHGAYALLYLAAVSPREGPSCHGRSSRLRTRPSSPLYSLESRPVRSCWSQASSASTQAPAVCWRHTRPPRKTSRHHQNSSRRSAKGARAAREDSEASAVRHRPSLADWPKSPEPADHDHRASCGGQGSTPGSTACSQAQNRTICKRPRGQMAR